MALIAGMAMTGGNAARLSPKTAGPVTIEHFQFEPAELSVSVGDSVVWVNADQLRHTTTSDSSAWTSPELAAGERFTWRAKRPGRFPYHCSAHPVMHGVIVVHP